MSIIYPICYVDAVGWSEVVTVRERMNYTSPNGKVKTTGSATFTYQRTHLKDILTNPALPFGTDDFFLSLQPDKGKFIAVQFGIGFQPGWAVFFGYQDSKEDAFTTTDNTDPHNPVTTKSFASCSVSAGCTQMAPEVYGYVTSTDQPGPYESQQAFIGINNGFTNGDPVSNTGVDVTLIQAGIKADTVKKQAEIPPVYRVTFPTDVYGVSAFSMFVNGANQVVNIGPSSYGSPSLSDYVGTAISMAEPGGAYLMELLSPWTIDVQMPHYASTLASGKVSYTKLKKADSSIYYAGGVSKITNPFPMSGQSFTTPANAQGYSVTIQL